MGKPFDVSKFRKEITKSIDGLSIGFNDPTDWISTGNFALNYLISGDFNKGIPSLCLLATRAQARVIFAPATLPSTHNNKAFLLC